MVVEFKRVYGKAKLTIEVNGCIDCGSIGSHEWIVAREIPVTVGGKEDVVEIMRCGRCAGIPEPSEEEEGEEGEK